MEGKVAIVTGASGGIGGAVAEELSRLGVKVVATGRNGDNLKKLAAKCKGEVNAVFGAKKGRNYLPNY